VKYTSKQIFLIVINIFLLVHPLMGQEMQYRFSHLSTTDGLSNNQVNCILKDSKGFMWFGTVSGLDRFDGYTFRIFKHEQHDNKSLNDNYVSSVFEDDKQRLWVTTRAGLNIYDPDSELFIHNIADILREYSLPDVSIRGMKRDRNGDYWMYTDDGRLFKYMPERDTSVSVTYMPPDSVFSGKAVISDLTIGPDGSIWVITQNGLLVELDPETNRVSYDNYELHHLYEGQMIQSLLYADQDGDLWISITNNARGLFYFKRDNRTLHHFGTDSESGRLNTNIVSNVVQDNHGLIWIGTDHGGINVLDKKDFSVRYLLNNPDDPNSLTQNVIMSLYKDNNGIIWAGTYKQGINYYHEDIIKFHTFQHIPSSNQSLGYNDVNSFAEDHSGKIWIGTNGGGLERYDPVTGNFQHFRHTTDPNSLSNDVIVSLLVDHKNRLWIGTYYGGLNMYDGKTFRHFYADPDDPGSLSDDRVWDICEDAQYNLWIATLGGGLELLKPGEKTFSHYRANDVNSVRSDFLLTLDNDKQGNIWIGADNGVDVLMKKTGRFIHFGTGANDSSGLSNDNISAMLADSRGLVWIGTQEGLNCYDPVRKKFALYRESNGLADNGVMSIAEDSKGNLWVGTLNGLSRMSFEYSSSGTIDSIEFRNYDQTDGLQGRAFNLGAACRTSNGKLLFGGADGFNYFDPSTIKVNHRIPKVVFTGFQLINQDVKVGQEINGRAILNQSVSQTQYITLKHSENMFSIEFTALSFFHPEKNSYKYRLVNFNDSWLSVNSNHRKATYTNLDPGNYIFRVKASNNDGFWNEEGATLHITILPPFWRTRWAIAAYILIVFAGLYFLRYIIVKRTHLRFQTEKERLESSRRHELDMLKIRFFTNVSHELRPPLILIITPLEQLVEETRAPEKSVQFQIMYRNARRLLNLVNQLLDFRKIEVQGITLEPEFGDLIQFIRKVAASFTDLAEDRNIGFTVHADAEELNMSFDPDKMEKIIFNLLSNAFKFTPANGSVDLSIAVENDQHESKQVKIMVTDTGIGIPADKQELVFERFFQQEMPGIILNQGSGIGLSLVREYVHLHKGTISVQSEPGEGSAFIIRLPADTSTNAVPVAKDGNETLPAVQPERKPNVSQGEISSDCERPLLLIIEDNEDFRFYLKDNLKNAYRILEASDGKEGWEKLIAYNPDLVVTDLMMPVMDGLQLMRKIRTDNRFKQLPVILLTARTNHNDELESIEAGADAYIPKPFSFEILESRIKNLLEKRRRTSQSASGKIEITPTSVNLASSDEKLIQKALQMVEKNMDNPDFSVVELSREMGMSRVHLYKKLTALTDKTPIEFIRLIRLKRAAQLLRDSQLSISEIAYKVGFNNPRYFSRYFKQEYNLLPSRFADKYKRT